MLFLKKGTTKCPYCKQILREYNDKLYCDTDGCKKVFDIYQIAKKEVVNNAK